MSLQATLYSQEMALTVPTGGNSGHLVCPDCGGGASKERSFIVWRSETGRVGYKCYRATCGSSGGFYATQSTLGATPAPKKPLRPFEGLTGALSDGDREYIWSKWGLTDEDISKQEIKRCLDTGRLVFPLYTRDGLCYGHELRSIGRKSRQRYWHVDDPVWMHYPKGQDRTSKRILLVEDIPSAIKTVPFANGAVAAALLGTTITDSSSHGLSKNFRKVDIALDADATEKAIGYKKKYGLMFDEFNVIKLERDIKDMAPDAIKELLSRET